MINCWRCQVSEDSDVCGDVGGDEMLVVRSCDVTVDVVMLVLLS